MMADKFFVDTNVLIYAHDRTTGVKHERARELVEKLWASGQGVLSTQVLQELCVNLRRKVARPLGVEEIRQLVSDYMSWEVVVNSPGAVIRALELEVRYKTSFWDALILQAAEQSGAAILYSEDLAAKQSYGTLRVVNPLAG
ncbi:MAG: PIN domain-containing protein [Candidatus Sulfotelmatobacter sp.]